MRGIAKHWQGSNWLVQVHTNNPMMSASPSGFFTIYGSLSKKSAEEFLNSYDEPKQRKMRLISKSKFCQELSLANS